MLRLGAVGLSSLLLGWSLTGCAGSYCSDPEHAAEATCQLNLGGTVAAFTVTPSRIKFNKDAETSITINAYSQLINQAAILTQNGTAKPLALGPVWSDGTLQTKIRAADLAAQGFVPGAAEVEIAGQKRRIRIFVAPTFDGNVFSAVRSVVADQGVTNLAAPSWVGISDDATKKIFTLNEYTIATIAKQAIGEYVYDPTNKAIVKSAQPLFSAYNSTPEMDMSWHSVALSTTDLLIPEFGNTSISLLTQCSLGGVCSSGAIPYGSIASLTTYPSAQIYAGIFNGKVLAFSDVNLTSSIAISDPAPSAALPSRLTVYDANEDAQPDLTVWHSDGNVSVLLSDSTGRSLAHDPKADDALESLGVLAGAAPDAAAAGDIDQDGLDDLVLAKGGALYILSNEGAGTFSAGTALAIPTRDAVGSAQLVPVSAIALGEVNAGDATRKHLVLVSKSNRLIAVMENTATAQ